MAPTWRSKPSAPDVWRNRATVVTNLAAFMADSQLPWGVEALQGSVTQPAWKSKPSWYLVSTDDRMIPPAAQRLMAQRAGATISEVGASHSVYVSQPEVVARLIAVRRCGRCVAPE